MADTTREVRLLSVPEAARLLGVGERFVWKMASTRELPTVKIGRRRLVALADIERFVESRREGGAR